MPPMSQFRDLFERKDFGPGLAAPHGDYLAYSDPASGVAENTPEITWFVVSDESVDRDGDVVRSGQWDVSHFLAAGAPWLYDHGEHDSRVIGKAVHPETGEPLLRVEQGRTLAGICWDSGPWGQEVKGLVDRDMVRTASIGFLPTAGRPRQKPPGMGGKRKDAWDIQSLELLELTITPTASNRNAMRLAIDRGELSPVITKSFRKALGMLADTAGGALGKEEGKSVDEHAEFKSKLEDCVGRKVKILMDEGKDQKQALAIAYSMCGEEHRKALDGDAQDAPEERMEKDKAKRPAPCPNCNGKAKAVTMPDMEDATQVDDGKPGSEAPPEDGAAGGPVEPHGVTVSKATLEHIQALLSYLGEHGLPGMEPDSAMTEHFKAEVVPVLHEVAAALHETATDHYPDHDFGEAPPVPEGFDEGEDEPAGDADEAAEGAEAVADEDAESPEEQADEEATGDEEHDLEDEEEEKELADRYARSARFRLLAKHYARKGHRVSKAAREVAMKAAGCMTKAADHMDETAESGDLPEEKSYMHKGHAAMLRKSADEVSRVHGGGSDDMPENGENGGTVPEEPEEKSADWSAVLGELASVRKGLRKALGKE